MTSTYVLYSQINSLSLKYGSYQMSLNWFSVILALMVYTALLQNHMPRMTLVAPRYRNRFILPVPQRSIAE